MRRLITALSLLLATGPLAAEPLGTPPGSAASRALSSVPNGESITRTIWAPGQDEGFVPQGVAVSGGRALMTAYREAGGCRLFEIDARSGKVLRQADVPACRHGGGVAVFGETVFVIDTRRLFIVSGAGRDFGTLKGELALGKGITGSLGTVHEGRLYLGTYTREGEGALFAFPAAAIAARREGTLRPEDAVSRATIPTRTQGMAFDARGRLWTSQSGKDWGTLTVEGRTLQAPAGIEGLAFTPAGALWTVSEAGSPRWLGWKTYFPVLMEIDTGRLR